MQPKNQNEMKKPIKYTAIIVFWSLAQPSAAPSQSSHCLPLCPAYHPVSLPTVGHAVVPAAGVAAPAKYNKAQTRGR